MSTTFDLVIRGQVLTEGGIAERTVAVTDGRIAAVETALAELAAVETVDLAVFAPRETWTVDPSALQHRHPVTPYAGRTVRGAVRATYLRGQRIDPSGEPGGALLTAGARRSAASR